MNPSLNHLKAYIQRQFITGRRLEGLRLSQSLYAKIGLGYVWAIAIAMSGSLLGLIGTDYYQGKAIEQLFDAQEQLRLLDDLQFSSAEVKFQGLRLDIRVGQNQAQQQRLTEFGRMRDQAIAETEALIAFIEADPAWLADDRDQFIALINAYARSINQYHNRLDNFFAQIKVAPTLSDVNIWQQQLTLVQRGQALVVLDALSLEMEQLRRQATQQAVSSGDRMETIQGYEKLAIILSLLTSMGLAAWIALRTTQQIATPIVEAASLAQRVASQADYSLRLPINHDDEVGRLAESLNYLIERIALRSQQLKTSASNARNKANKLQQTLANLEETQAQLIQSEKMSSLGQLVAGIAHEINNPTNFIYGNIHHARDYLNDLICLLQAYQHAYPDNEELNELADEFDLEFIFDDLQSLMESMDTGAKRISEIVRSLRTFSRLDEAEVKQVDLHEGIDSTLMILNTRFRMFPSAHPLKLVKDYGLLPPVECYRNQVNQVVMNLIVNAIDALEEGVAAGKWDAPPSPDSAGEGDRSIEREPCVTIRTRDQGNGWIRIDVSDNALGIPEAARAKLFDPFFTTKTIGKGTGLGLSICYKIITETHRGQLTYDTTIGSGTTFSICLPKSLSVECAY